LLNKCNKNSIISIETMGLAKSSLLGISKRVWDKSLKLLQSVQHQMFDAVVYRKSLSLATQGIRTSYKLCGGGTTKSKLPFHNDLPIFVPLSDISRSQPIKVDNEPIFY
ncbi:hypothetical protein LGW47_09140, partial [Streptococcus mutans]|nr:hypothetical protein [Streptococcus mutans]